jgi:hypothetical protein
MEAKEYQFERDVQGIFMEARDNMAGIHMTDHMAEELTRLLTQFTS